MPETANLSLEQLQALFDGPQKPTSIYQTFENPLSDTIDWTDGTAPVTSDDPEEVSRVPSSPPAELELASNDRERLLPSCASGMSDAPAAKSETES